jgi:hypothetical protein
LNNNVENVENVENVIKPTSTIHDLNLNIFDDELPQSTKFQCSNNAKNGYIDIPHHLLTQYVNSKQNLRIELFFEQSDPLKICYRLGSNVFFNTLSESKGRSEDKSEDRFENESKINETINKFNTLKFTIVIFVFIILMFAIYKYQIQQK